MSSREKILAAVLQNQPPQSPLPDISIFQGEEKEKVEKYMETFINIGGRAFLVENIAEVKQLIRENFR
jgi:L-lactate dehydrogenase complex protein LldG